MQKRQKTAAQLDREIVASLAKSSKKRRTHHASMKETTFFELAQDPDPAALEVAEDLLLKKGWKMSDVVGGRRHGTIELLPMHGPKHEWKMVQWHVHETDFPGHVEIEIDVANGKERIKRNEIVSGSWDYARKTATADAWAIAKAIKKLPLATDHAKLAKVVDKALDKDNVVPEELF